jgi:hypothetical protein
MNATMVMYFIGQWRKKLWTVLRPHSDLSLKETSKNYKREHTTTDAAINIVMCAGFRDE